MSTTCIICEIDLVVPTTWYASMAARSRRTCKTCHKAAVRKSQAGSDRFKEYQRERRKTHPVVAKPRELTAEQKEAARLRCAAYRARNPGVAAEKARLYREQNPDRVRASRRRGNAMRRAAKADGFDANEVAKFYDLAVALTAKFGVVYEVDHIIPISRGGKHHQDNLVVMRWDLNRAKAAKRWIALEKHFGVGG